MASTSAFSLVKVAVNKFLFKKKNVASVFVLVAFGMLQFIA